LLACVESILRNDFQDFEIIIVDQDPAQTLQAKLTQRFKHDHRLVYLFLAEASASRARNLGIRHARGRILTFSDDDTEVEPHWLRAYLDAFDACGGERAVLSGRLDPWWLAPKPRWLPERKEYLLGIYNKHDRLAPMPQHDLIISANFAVHRTAMDAIAGFDERLGYSYARRHSMLGGEDSLWSLRARQAQYGLYHQPAARSWHKIAPYKLRKAYFVRRSFWEGITLLTVLHLSGTIPADHWHRVVAWQLREGARWAGRLLRVLLRRDRAGSRARDAMEAVCSVAQSVGVIRAALRLRATGRLPW
jgi:glycosyltransferase involved in cell wall biosynthesis